MTGSRFHVSAISGFNFLTRGMDFHAEIKSICHLIWIFFCGSEFYGFFMKMLLVWSRFCEIFFILSSIFFPYLMCVCVCLGLFYVLFYCHKLFFFCVTGNSHQQPTDFMYCVCIRPISAVSNVIVRQSKIPHFLSKKKCRGRAFIWQCVYIFNFFFAKKKMWKILYKGYFPSYLHVQLYRIIEHILKSSLWN